MSHTQPCQGWCYWVQFVCKKKVTLHCGCEVRSHLREGWRLRVLGPKREQVTEVEKIVRKV